MQKETYWKLTGNLLETEERKSLPRNFPLHLEKNHSKLRSKIVRST